MSNRKAFFTCNTTQSQRQQQTQQQQTQQQQTHQQQQTQQQSDDDEEVLHFPDDSQEYANFREKYKNKRLTHVPLDCIDIVINHHFPNESATINEYDEYTRLLKVKISDLLLANVVNWEFNREPDFLRIPEIARYIYQSKKQIMTTLYMNYNFKLERFELIDGTHRYKALQTISSLHRENGVNVNPRLEGADFSWFITDENIDWLMNMYIVINVCFNSTRDNLMELRDNINCSQPMQLKFNQSDVEKMNILNKIADEYTCKYKKCFTPSNNSSTLRQSRKSNRDNFILLLGELYDKFNIDINRVGILTQKLEIANRQIKAKLLNDEIKCSQDAKDRCLAAGCCLFMYRDDELKDFIN
jgi:hypothetical protein